VPCGVLVCGPVCVGGWWKREGDGVDVRVVVSVCACVCVCVRACACDQGRESMTKLKKGRRSVARLVLLSQTNNISLSVKHYDAVRGDVMDMR
jgi:hypothetical protein